ncbi:MAG: right-handed parallel beta-helix repeat-containing protein [Prevotella sp.]|nr:right-handed parallel beta-helix repeat-containing protein [Prevotella sp.]
MRRIFTLLLLMSFTCIYAQDAETEADIRAWNLSSVPAEDVANITADSQWSKDSKNRYCFKGAITDAPITANGTELTITKGLRFNVLDGSTNSDGRNLYMGGSTNGLWLGDGCVMIIPDAKAGQYIKVEYMTSNKSNTRTMSVTNVVKQLASTSGTTHTTDTARIVADGEVRLTIPKGIYFYNLSVGDSIVVAGSASGGATPSDTENPDNPKDETHAFDITQDFSLMHTNIYGNGPKIYVSPTGNDSNDGATPETPLLSIQKAVNMAVDPGTTIILAPGEYRPTARINIDQRNGTHDNYNAMVCLDGRAVINCDHPYHKHSDNPYQGVRLTSSYWYFYHIDITNASDNGMLIERNKPAGGSSSDVANANDQAHDNIIEACNFYKNGDTGLQMKNLAAYNYIINCDAYLNCDEDQGDADGFAPKISVGTGNYFFGCRAYLNSDDGWDVFYKKDSGFGDNMTIIMDQCISYKNGFLDENTIAPDGNGNGFKCGSNQGAMNVYLNRCLAVKNKAKGFDQNHNSGDIILNNCTGFTSTENGSKTYSYRIYEDINTGDGHKVELTNCIAINDNDEKDKRDSNGNVKPSEYGKYGTYGRFEVDETLPGLTVKTSEFQKAFPMFFESMDHAQLIAPRDANDNLSDCTFAHIKPSVNYSYTGNMKNSPTFSASSDALIDSGTKIETTEYQGLPVPAIPYSGSAPDLGAYETGTITGIGSITAGHARTGNISLHQTQGGSLLISVAGATLSDSHDITLHDLAGKQIAAYSMRGATTAIALPAVNATCILTVKGSKASESVKLRIKAE